MTLPKATTSKTTHIGIAACLIAIDKSASAIQLFPSGEFEAPLGALIGNGPWQLNGDSAQQLIKVVAARKNDILIDYEHHSISANKEGHTAVAAGWINPLSLFWQDDGLYAQNPDWKAKAAAMIEADEYRYLSPVFIYDKNTGTPLNILSVALTNTPAIDGMATVSLAAAMANYNPPQETSMDLSELMERLCYLLNLPITTTPDEMAGQLDKMKAMLGAEPVAAASLPELLASKDEEIAALKTAIPDPAKYVPVEALQAVLQQRQEEQGASVEQQVAALIAAHPNIIIPALEPWATALGKQDVNQLQAYIDKVVPIAALTATQTGGKAPESRASTLTAEEQHVARQLGLTTEQILKNRGIA